MSESLLQEADALMQRHRRYVARPSKEADVAGASVADEEAAEDVPLLTEAIDETAPALLPYDPNVIEAELLAWLREALPQALQDLSEDLLAILADRAASELMPRLSSAAPQARQGSL